MLGARVSEKIKQSGIAQVASLIALGRRLAEAGQWPWAHRLFVHATKLDPANEEAWMWRAGIASDASETIVCLKRVLELNPQNEQAQAGLRWAVSKQAPASAIPDVPEQAAAMLEEGQRALREGDRLGAYERFKRATELDAQNPSAWFWRGSAALGIDEALECMDQVLSIDPGDEAAKDARWWLRVQKLRAHTSALASPHPTPPVISPYAERYEQKRNGGIPLVAVFMVAMLIVGLLMLLVVLRLAGYL
jgi:tetratricopeptide (TPR) repeat protein